MATYVLVDGAGHGKDVDKQVTHAESTTWLWPRLARRTGNCRQNRSDSCWNPCTSSAFTHSTFHEASWSRPRTR
jgi:hypothetical protein